MGEEWLNPAAPKEPIAKDLEAEQQGDPIRFTYPDGTVGTAKTRKEAADKIEEYREGNK